VSRNNGCIVIALEAILSSSRASGRPAQATGVRRRSCSRMIQVRRTSLQRLRRCRPCDLNQNEACPGTIGSKLPLVGTRDRRDVVILDAAERGALPGKSTSAQELSFHEVAAPSCGVASGSLGFTMGPPFGYYESHHRRALA
jgi:hypothetical protein